MNDFSDYVIDPGEYAANFASGKIPGSAAALGSFDGLHLGHASLINAVEEVGKKRSLTKAVWTFSQSEFFRKSGDVSDRRMRYIVGDFEKLALFAFYGLELVSMNDFSDVRELDCGSFVTEHLVKRLGVRAAVCGEDFRFGRGGLGNAASLGALMEKTGGECVVCGEVSDESGAISSTRIRELIASGETEPAGKLLGRPFILSGKIEHGRRLGRTLGIPTLNMRFPENGVIPRFGVYETICAVDTGSGVLVRPSVTNVGMRPTVEALPGGDAFPVGETYVIGFDGDVYGKKACVAFGKFVRPELKFSGTDELKNRMKSDIAARGVEL